LKNLKKGWIRKSNVKNIANLSRALIVSRDPDYRAKIEQMYSGSNLSGKYKQLDFQKAIDDGIAENNRAKKWNFGTAITVNLNQY
jgi:hypothetical protein